MGRISDWLDNLLMGGDEGKIVDVSLIEEDKPTDEKLIEGKKRQEEARKENEKEAKAEDDLKHVIDQAKLECKMCVTPMGDLKVNYDTPSIQDKKIATVKEKDMTSIMFKGNCTKSPNSASPCAGVMQLGEWKDTGTSLIQDQPPLLLKSTIKCNFGGSDIKITDCGQKAEPENIDVVGAPVADKKIEKEKVEDFDIKLSLNKDNDTLVPLGIVDFNNNKENQFIKFKVTISGKGVNKWELDIKNKDKIIYTLYSATDELKEVVVTGKSKKGTKTTSEEKPKADEIKRFWPAGEYELVWDGFDKEGIYKSVVLLENSLTASIKGFAEFKEKTSETVKLEFERKEVSWVDVEINKKTKRIDVTLRVNLTDGGAVGLNCNTYATESETSYETYTPTTNQPDPFKDTKVTICDWDKIPQKVLKSLKEPVLKTRTKTFEQLKDLAISGLAKYWSRNKIRGKNVMLNSIAFEVYVHAVNLKDKSKTMDDIPLVYHTNGDWGRSGNPASPAFNAIPDTGIVQQISYNAGYIKRFDSDSRGLEGWRYSFEKDNPHIRGTLDYDAISEFKETVAHEIGHEILQAYYGAIFSWQHKGSSYLNQETKPTEADKPTLNKIAEYIPLAPYIPVIKPIDSMPDSKGEYYPKSPDEIDLMKYYNTLDKNGKFVSGEDLSRTFAAEKDVLGLIWLTKLKLR